MLVVSSLSSILCRSLFLRASLSAAVALTEALVWGGPGFEAAAGGAVVAPRLELSRYGQQ